MRVNFWRHGRSTSLEWQRKALFPMLCRVNGRQLKLMILVGQQLIGIHRHISRILKIMAMGYRLVPGAAIHRQAAVVRESVFLVSVSVAATPKAKPAPAANFHKHQ